jgi:EmrB/QacA subfamily drug resistance transporter
LSDAAEVPIDGRGAARRRLGSPVEHGSPRAKRLALTAAIMGSFVVGVDATVVNVALPAIERDLGGGLAAQQWVLNSYLLTLGSLLLIGGSLGDLFGERRVFALGVAGFGMGSLLCAVAPTIEVLIAARALQGIAGALLTPTALAVIVATFEPNERGAAIGSWTAWTGIAAVVGPLAGGALIGLASWRWIFAVNIPFVAATLALVSALPGRAAASPRAKVDVAGAVLCAVGLAGPVFALIEQPRLGWSSPAVLAGLAGGSAVLAVFLLHERRTQAPMLPLDLFRRRNFTAANLETLFVYAGLSILFFFLILFLQQVAGYSAFESGFATLPVTVVIFALSRRFGGLADRYGSRLFMAGGPLISAVGMLLLLRVDAHPDYLTDLLPALLLFSLGLALTVAPLTATVLADADEHNAGVASGINTSIARVAGLLGTAALGAVVAAQFSSALDARLGDRPLDRQTRIAVAQAKKQPLARVDPRRLPAPEGREVASASERASTKAFHVGMGIASGLLFLGGAVGAAGIRDRRRPVRAEQCPGGALVGAPLDASRGRRHASGIEVFEVEASG